GVICTSMPYFAPMPFSCISTGKYDWLAFAMVDQRITADGPAGAACAAGACVLDDCDAAAGWDAVGGAGLLGAGGGAPVAQAARVEAISTSAVEARRSRMASSCSGDRLQLQMAHDLPRHRRDRRVIVVPRPGEINGNLGDHAPGPGAQHDDAIRQEDGLGDV